MSWSHVYRKLVSRRDMKQLLSSYYVCTQCTTLVIFYATAIPITKFHAATICNGADASIHQINILKKNGHQNKFILCTWKTHIQWKKRLKSVARCVARTIILVRYTWEQLGRSGLAQPISLSLTRSNQARFGRGRGWAMTGSMQITFLSFAVRVLCQCVWIHDYHASKLRRIAHEGSRAAKVEESQSV